MTGLQVRQTCNSSWIWMIRYFTDCMGRVEKRQSKHLYSVLLIHYQPKQKTSTSSSSFRTQILWLREKIVTCSISTCWFTFYVMTGLQVRQTCNSSWIWMIRYFTDCMFHCHKFFCLFPHILKYTVGYFEVPLDKWSCWTPEQRQRHISKVQHGHLVQVNADDDTDTISLMEASSSTVLSNAILGVCFEDCGTFWFTFYVMTGLQVRQTCNPSRIWLIRYFTDCMFHCHKFVCLFPHILKYTEWKCYMWLLPI
jgi:hypothetical protein